MKIDERTFRRILREEASRELSGVTTAPREFKLTLSEIRALRSLGTRASRLNEADATEIAFAAAESKYGRKIMVSILKAIKFISGLDVLMLKHIHSPLWQKARDFIERKFDVNIPFTGDEFFDIAKWFAPGHYVGIVIDELVGILSDMSDEEFSDQVKKHSGKSISRGEPRFSIGDKVRAKLANPESSKQVWTVEGIIESDEGVEYELRSGEGDHYSETTFPEKILMLAGAAGTEEGSESDSRLSARFEDAPARSSGSPRFKVGDEVLVKSSRGEPTPATIARVHKASDGFEYDVAQVSKSGNMGSRSLGRVPERDLVSGRF